MFTQTLTLKGPAPQVVFGAIKPRRRAKVVPKAWQLQVELNGRPVRTAVDTNNYAGYEHPESVAATRELKRMLDAAWDEDEGFGYDEFYGIYDSSDCYDFYDYRELEVGDAEDYIEPRLRTKLGKRPTIDTYRGWSWRCYRGSCYRSWKHRRETQYHAA